MYSFCSLSVEWRDQKTRKQAYEQQLPQALLTMPGQIPEAVKKRNNLEEHESAIQKAMEEYLATRDQPSPPGQTMLANKYGVPRSTLTARIQGRPSKLDSASKQQKILPEEEELIVAYLQETARRGFPDTKKRCVRRANEILRARSGNPTATVGISWLGRFLHRHRDKVRCYWSTTLTTVRGGALNSNTVDHWFNLLQQTVTDYGIEQDCIFSMDETCCFLDKCTQKTRHIGSASAHQQLALRNEVRETATMIPIISASGMVFPPTVIFQGTLLRKKETWENPLNAM